MKLHLSPEVVDELTVSLSEAGQREIGGILMGAHVGVDTFRVTEMTVQRKGGTFAAFVRLVEGIVSPLRAFFRTHHNNYTRFNYLGEWHSHHSFALNPSMRDHNTMNEIVNDQRLGARFVVLLIVRLDERLILETSLTIYQPGVPPRNGFVSREEMDLGADLLYRKE